MKTYISNHEIRIVGKAWEVRHQLRVLLQKEQSRKNAHPSFNRLGFNSPQLAEGSFHYASYFHRRHEEWREQFKSDTDRLNAEQIGGQNLNTLSFSSTIVFLTFKAMGFSHRT